MKPFCFAVLLVCAAGPSCKHDSPVKPPPDVPSADTSSHAFTWIVDTLGDDEGTILYDVAVVNKDDIWVVGEIRYADSTNPNRVTMYNAGHWDGTRWNLKKIPTYAFSMTDSVAGEICALLVFGNNDIWYSSQACLIHWDGNSYTRMITVWNGELYFKKQINKIWGERGSDMYMVGLNGALYHYDGKEVRLIETITNADLTDIWGVRDNQTKELEILAVGGKLHIDRSHAVVRIQSNMATMVNDTGITSMINGIWFSQKHDYYIVGDGLFQKTDASTKAKWKDYSLVYTSYFLYAIRGNSWNDIVAVGALGEIIHYNGNNWKSYRDVTANPYGNFRRVAMHGDAVAAIGYCGQRGLVARGVR